MFVHRLLPTVLLAGAAVAGLCTAGGTVGVRAQEPTPVFTASSDLVVLQVTVRERSGAYVSGLLAEAFVVLEDDVPQHIRLFAPHDAPVTAGLLIDGSGSMGESREKVITAAAAFVDLGNRGDEVFALTFNEHIRTALPAWAPFTDDPATMRKNLFGAIPPRGRTALYDAIAAGLAYLEQGTYHRQVLVVLSDGGDNASKTTFDEVLRMTQESNSVIHTIAFRDPVDFDANPGRLRRIAEGSGGDAYAPRIGEIDPVLRQIAGNIRRTYTIGYVPTNSVRDGQFRRVTVRVTGPAGRDVRVRTRPGYLAGKP